MPTTVAELQAKIGLEGVDTAKKSLKSVGESADSAGKHLDGLGGSLGTLKNAFIGGLGAIGGAITGMLGVKVVGDAIDFVKDQVVDLFRQAMSQQAVMAQTAAVIKSTGGAAGISAEQVGDLSDALARQTGISDDTIQSASNILLTFRAINKDIFPQTTSLVLDMATAMHEDFNSAAIQIGKALQDPIQGVTALRRVGVQLSQQQQDAVKHFMAVGNQAAAQKIIMDELTKEVGGSAAAYGKTLPGQMARLGVSFDQMKEKIGLAVIPVLQSLIDKYLMPLADWLGKELPVAITIVTNFLNNQFVPAVNAVMNSPVVKTIEGWAQSFAKTLPQAAGTGTKALDHRGMAGGADKATISLKHLKSQSNDAGKTIDSKDGLVGHVNAGTLSVLGLASAIDAPDTPAKPHLTPAMTRYMNKLKQLDGAQQRANQQAQSSIPVISGIGDAFGQAGRALGGFIDGIKERFPAAEPQIQRFGDFISATFQGVLPGIQTMWEGFWNVISTPVKIAFHSIEGIINVGMDLLGGKFDKMQADTQTMFTNLKDDALNFGKGFVQILVGPFQAGLGGIISAVKNFPKLFDAQWQRTINDITNWVNSHVPHFDIGIFSQLPGQHRASGGPVSGAFVGAERGPELLVTPGIYHAPPGSYVYNAQQTRNILSDGSDGRRGSMMRGSGGAGGGGGNTYVTNVYPQQATLDTAALARIQRRRELLTGMGVS